MQRQLGEDGRWENWAATSLAEQNSLQSTASWNCGRPSRTELPSADSEDGSGLPVRSLTAAIHPLPSFFPQPCFPFWAAGVSKQLGHAKLVEAFQAPVATMPGSLYCHENGGWRMFEIIQ